MKVFVAPGETVNNSSRVEPSIDKLNNSLEIPAKSKETPNGDIVSSDLVVATERRAPEGQDNEIKDEFQPDSKSTAVGMYSSGQNGQHINSKLIKDEFKINKPIKFLTLRRSQYFTI